MFLKGESLIYYGMYTQKTYFKLKTPEMYQKK